MTLDLNALEAVARTADCWGPWAIWRDLTDGGFVHVGNLEGIIPEGETVTPDDAEPNAIAKCYTPEIAEHIAAFDPPTVRALITRLREAERHNVQLLREAVKREGRVKRAEGAIAEALNHDPLHGRKEGMHCGGMAPCIRDALTAYRPTNQEGGSGCVIAQFDERMPTFAPILAESEGKV